MIKNKMLKKLLKEGLEMLTRAKAYQGLKEFKGKYKFTLDLDDLREDKK